MLGTAIQHVEALFSRRFLLAGFFPWLLFGAANVLVYDLAWRPAPVLLPAWLAAPAGTQAVVLAAVLVATAAVAFVTAPLLPLLRAVLEGRVRRRGRAGRLLEALRVERRHDLQNVEKELRQLRRACLALPGRHEAALARLRAAAEAGAGSGREHPASLAEAQAAVEAMWAGGSDAERLLEEAVGKAERAAWRNDARASPTLEDLFGEFRRASLSLGHWAERELVLRYDQRQTFFAQNDLAATRIGNIAAATRAYALLRYNISLDFFWPRLRTIISGHEAISEALDQAETHLSFLVLTFFLILVFAIVWSVVPVLALGPLPLFVGVAVAGPAAAWCWLALVAQAEVALGQLVRSALDLHRHELLQALRVGVPRRHEDERRLWGILREALAHGERDLPVLRRPVGS
ncbi:hypothetical protein [Marinimicrococcus flavescens]|uniref:Uncharacterized protein n=1 Tax=Marinimicrococcus flavescens TaxID=3031815 RepID=A0AAP3UXZ6_9PROT|nr:hypothetical protein [Marinimicrococcus flavescens]